MTSRYASSSDSGSTSGVTARKIAKTCCETARYFWKSGRTIDQLRAEANRARHRDRRAHAERARLVAGGRDDAARCRAAADRDRLARAGRADRAARPTRRTRPCRRGDAPRQGSIAYHAFMIATSKLWLRLGLCCNNSRRPAGGISPTRCKHAGPSARSLQGGTSPEQHQAAHEERSECRGVFFGRRQPHQFSEHGRLAAVRSDLHDET